LSDIVCHWLHSCIWHSPDHRTWTHYALPDVGQPQCYVTAEKQETAEVETTTPTEDQETADTEDVPDAQLITIKHNIQVQRKRAADG
jgi:hypothetical protein